jgi:methylated-DNA-[protein]-cysteine S-methyltransferase
MMRIETKLGPCHLSASESGLTGAHLERAGEAPPPVAVPSCAARAHLRAAARALEEYFCGARRDFDDLRLAPAGTPFQLAVWRALRGIPFGRTTSYGELARRIGRPGAARAVGMANHRNPIWIIIPCHRVIGADGSLTGYGGGLPAKEWLLAHEASTLPIG